MIFSNRVYSFLKQSSTSLNSYPVILWRRLFHSGLIPLAFLAATTDATAWIEYLYYCISIDWSAMSVNISVYIRRLFALSAVWPSSENRIPNDSRADVKFSGLITIKSQFNQLRILFSHLTIWSQLKLARLEIAQKSRIYGILSSSSSYLLATMRRVTPKRYFDRSISSALPSRSSLSR